MAEALEINRRKKAQLVPLLLTSEITGKNLARPFMEKKIASQERMVLMSNCREKSMREYFIVKYDDEGFTMTKREFKIDKEFKIMIQMVIGGYFITKSPSKIFLYNPDNNQSITSPDLQTVEFVGNYGGRFTILSLEMMDDVEHTVAQVWAFTTGSASGTWEPIITDIKICLPCHRCINIERYIYFTDKPTPDGLDEYTVLCFDIIEHTIDLIEIPSGLRLSGNHCLVNLQGSLAIVDSEDFTEGKFEIWLEKDKNLFLYHTCAIGTKLWEYFTSLNGYAVSHATVKGEIVWTPTLIPQTMKQEKSAYALIYDPRERQLVAIDISKMKVKKRGVVYMDDAED